MTVRKQAGAVLILLAFILGLGATAYLLQAAHAINLQAKQDEKTYQVLGEAKQALIAWAVSNRLHPGQMPFPDRNADGNYDGKSDCNSPLSTFVYSFLLGQLPIYGQTNPCIAPQVGIGSDLRDAQGNRLWYAVSRNLVHKYETDPLNTNPVDPVINPSIIHNPVYQWLRVLDRNGALISDRVAAVILASGTPLSNQNRTALAGSSEFLDTFTIGVKTYSNANYDVANEDFIIGQDSKTVTASDTGFVAPYNFNDKLVYITIDELMAELNSRVAAEASALLKQYRAKTGQYPYAANLAASVDTSGNMLNNNISVPDNTKGMLPIDVTDSCSCTSFQSCNCSFQAITDVTFTKNSGTWATSTGACIKSTAKCTCNGAGSCSRATINFMCDNAGTCTTNQTGVNLFTYTVPSYADVKPDDTGCFLAGSSAACNGMGTFTIGLKEAVWFKENLWQDYFYYAWSLMADLQSGSKTNIGALLLAVGEPIIYEPYASKGGAQNRAPTNPTPNLNDYLDSAENTDGNAIFDAINKQKTNNYNDQTFIVEP